MKKILFAVYFGVTVFISHAEDAKHEVKSGQGLYSIARLYNVKAADIAKANGITNYDDIKIGQTLLIPGAVAPVSAPLTAPITTTNTAKVVEKPVVAKPKEVVTTAPLPVQAKVHTVVKGDGLYAICKKYNVSVADVRKWNSLATDNVRIGQKLIVAKANSDAIYKPMAVASTPDTPYTQEDIRPRTVSPEILRATAGTGSDILLDKPASATTKVEIGDPITTPKPVISDNLKTGSANPEEYPGIFTGYSASGFKVKRNRGAANYLLDNTSGNQYLAFYSGAETGTIIRVTNMMNNKSIFAKVVGKVPPTDAASEVVVKLSNTAASQLGAVDEKFLVEVTSYAEAK